MRNSPIVKKFGDEVRFRRLERKLTQEALAHEAGLCVGTIQLLEGAKIEIQLITLFRVAAGLKMPAAQLIAAVEG